MNSSRSTINARSVYINFYPFCPRSVLSKALNLYSLCNLLLIAGNLSPLLSSVKEHINSVILKFFVQIDLHDISQSAVET